MSFLRFLVDSSCRTNKIYRPMIFRLTSVSLPCHTNDQSGESTRYIIYPKPALMQSSYIFNINGFPILFIDERSMVPRHNLNHLAVLDFLRLLGHKTSWPPEFRSTACPPVYPGWEHHQISPRNAG